MAFLLGWKKKKDEKREWGPIRTLAPPLLIERATRKEGTRQML